MKEWLPTIVASGSLGIVLFIIRSWREDYIQQAELAMKKADCVDKKLPDKYLSKTEHQQLCQIASLTIIQHFSSELNRLKDEIFGELRKTQEMIKTKNNGQ